MDTSPALWTAILASVCLLFGLIGLVYYRNREELGQAQGGEQVQELDLQLQQAVKVFGLVKRPDLLDMILPSTGILMLSVMMISTKAKLLVVQT